MTTKDVDMKLVNDIARIRVILSVAQSGRGGKTSFSDELRKVMKELDAAKEETIAAEIESYTEAESLKQILNMIMTPSYIQYIISKLRIRTKIRQKKAIKNFTDADYRQILKIKPDEVARAAQTIIKAFRNQDNPDMNRETVIRGILAELYAYDEEKLKEDIMAQIADQLPEDLKRSLRFYYTTFQTADKEAIEYLDKVFYYGGWIYERFQPAGVICVKIVEPDQDDDEE